MPEHARRDNVLLEGDAPTRGITHGEKVAHRIVESLERADFMSRQDTGRPFDPDAFCTAHPHPQYEECRNRMSLRQAGATWETFPPVN